MSLRPLPPKNTEFYADSKSVEKKIGYQKMFLKSYGEKI
jgi:hypothetical protein